jgi:hypothetical protein
MILCTSLTGTAITINNAKNVFQLSRLFMVKFSEKPQPEYEMFFNHRIITNRTNRENKTWK